MQFSITALADKIQSEADAYRYIEELRWGDTPVCPHCDRTERISFLNPADGVARKTRTGNKSERRVWFCGVCRKQFSVLTGTVLHGTKISIRKWLFVMYEMCANKNGLAAREIERKYEVTAKTAWFMAQRVREAMKRDPLAGAMRGTIVADETYMGGKPGNHPEQGKPRPYNVDGSPAKYRARGMHDKTPVLSLLSEETGESAPLSSPKSPASRSASRSRSRST